MIDEPSICQYRGHEPRTNIIQIYIYIYVRYNVYYYYIYIYVTIVMVNGEPPSHHGCYNML